MLKENELVKFISNKVTVLCTAIVVLPVSAYYIFKYCQNMLDKTDPGRALINEVMFFSDEGLICKNHFRNLKVNCPLDSCPFRHVRRIVDYILSAEKCLDVCLYLVTVEQLSEAIVQVQKRGVKVRIITDEDMANGTGSQMLLFRQKGIKVRNQHKTTTLMHHKFVIIDKHILMSGSLNWTMQAISGNWENLVVTSQPQIVRPFVTEFERLWTRFEQTY